MKDLLTTTEVAKIIGVTPVRIRQLVIAGVLPVQKIGRDHFVKPEDLKLLENRNNGRPKRKAA